MFPPGGASTLKSFTSPAFAATAGVAAGPHHHHHNRQRVEEVEGLGVLDHIHPPVRPVRHVQHAAQHWAETKTTVAPGLIVRSTTATVSQWSEYTTASVQQTTEMARTTSSTQFQTIRSAQQHQPACNISAPALTSAQYLDDLQVILFYFFFLAERNAPVGTVAERKVNA